MDDISAHCSLQYVLESFSFEIETAGDITNDERVGVFFFDEVGLGFDAGFLLCTTYPNISDNAFFTDKHPKMPTW